MQIRMRSAAVFAILARVMAENEGSNFSANNGAETRREDLTSEEMNDQYSENALNKVDGEFSTNNGIKTGTAESEKKVISLIENPEISDTTTTGNPAGSNGKTPENQMCMIGVETGTCPAKNTTPPETEKSSQPANMETISFRSVFNDLLSFLASPLFLQVILPIASVVVLLIVCYLYREKIRKVYSAGKQKISKKLKGKSEFELLRKSAKKTDEVYANASKKSQNSKSGDEVKNFIKSSVVPAA